MNLERLESRILLTTVTGAGLDNPVVQNITDASGDVLQIRFIAPEGAEAEILDTTGSGTFNGSEEDDIGSITFTDVDFNSQFSIRDINPGVGGDTIVVDGSGLDGSIETAGDEDMGLISLGVRPDGEYGGTTSFAGGESVDIGGRLGAFLTSGVLDFDEGDFSITAGGDIGLVLADSIVAEPMESSGFVDIAAGGPDGDGDISLLLTNEGITEGTEGDPLEAVTARVGHPVTIRDDVGDGTEGSLRFSLALGSADIYAVSVPGGGQVVSQVDLASRARIHARGRGGDVGLVQATVTNTRLLVTGAPDTDVGVVEGTDVSLHSVVNRTRGGDLAIVDSAGSIGRVVTGRRGNVGALLTGAGNSTFLYPQTEYFSDTGVEASGNVGLIRTGSLVNALVDVGGNVRTIDTRPGGVINSEVLVGGNLTRLLGNYASESDVEVMGTGRLMSFGGRGVFDSDFNYVGGLTRAHVRRDFVDSSLTSLLEVEDGFVYGAEGPIGASVGYGLEGGMIRHFMAGGLSSSDLAALDGFGTIRVRNQVIYSDIDTQFYSYYEEEAVGGGIRLLSMGGMVESDVDVFENLDHLRSGTIIYSDLDIGGNLGSAVIASDVLETWMNVDGNLTGRLLVTGDMVNDYAEIDIEGNSNVINIRGTLSVGDGIEIGGNSNRIVVGGGSEGSDIEIDGDSGFVWARFLTDDTYLEIGGDSGVVAVGTMTADSAIEIDGDSRIVRVGRYDDAEIDIGGDSGLIRIMRASRLDDIDVGGNARRIIIGSDGGSAIDGDYDDLYVGGNLGHAMFGGGLVEYDIEVDGDVGPSSLVINGSASQVDIEVAGRAERIIVRGALHDSDLEADEGFGRIIVSEVISDTDIDSVAFDGEDPVGGGIDLLRAAALEDVDITLHGDLSRALVRGIWHNVDVDLSTEAAGVVDGEVVGGGGINLLTGRGLVSTEIRTYTALRRVLLGSTGIDEDSEIHVTHAEMGDLDFLRTTGLVFGDIKVGADTGPILTGGALAAVPVSPPASPIDGSPVDRLFVDADGVPTGGTLAVDGSLNGLVS
jgi:hypothetical protein